MSEFKIVPGIRQNTDGQGQIIAWKESKYAIRAIWERADVSGHSYHIILWGIQVTFHYSTSWKLNVLSITRHNYPKLRIEDFMISDKWRFNGILSRFLCKIFLRK